MLALRDRPVNTHLRPRGTRPEHIQNTAKANIVRLGLPHRSLRATSKIDLHPPASRESSLPHLALPKVIVSPPAPAVAAALSDMSSSPAYSASNASPSSIPLPHGLDSRRGYPVRRDNSPSNPRPSIHPIRRHSDSTHHDDNANSTGIGGADSPSPQNFSRPRTAHDHRHAVIIGRPEGRRPTASSTPSLKTAVVGKPERPRIVHNKGSGSTRSMGVCSPIPAGTPDKQDSSPSSGKEDDLLSSPEVSHFGNVNTAPSAASRETMPLAKRQPNQIATEASNTVSISEELTFKFNRHLFPPPQPVRFASSLPSIPSQKSLQFDHDHDSDDDGSSFGLEITDVRLSQYTLTRSPSPLSSSSPSEHETRASPAAEKPTRQTRVPSIGYPSSAVRDAYPARSIEPPDVPRERTSNSSLRQPFVRGAFARPTASTAAKVSPPLQHHRSRSRQVINKLSGIFSSTKRNSAPVVANPKPNAATDPPASRPQSSSDDSSVMSDEPAGEGGINGMVMRDLARVKALVQTLKNEAEKEDDTMRELSLRQAAQILQESMISAVEARISATKAEEEAERARMNCEMVSKSVERLLRIQ